MEFILDNPITQSSLRAALTARTGEQLTPAMIREIVADAQAGQACAHQLIHGGLLPLAKKVEIVKSYPDLNRRALDRAIAQATDLIAYFNKESPKHPLWTLVIEILRETPAATLRYLLGVCPTDKYDRWGKAYGDGIPESRICIIRGGPRFVPNRISIKLLDLAGHWDWQRSAHLGETQHVLPVTLAGFSALWAGVQEDCIPQADGLSVPYIVAAGLLLDEVPGCRRAACSPGFVRPRPGARMELTGLRVNERYYRHAFPTEVILRRAQR